MKNLSRVTYTVIVPYIVIKIEASNLLFYNTFGKKLSLGNRDDLVTGPLELS